MLIAVTVLVAATGCAPAARQDGFLNDLINAALKLGIVPPEYQQFVVAAGKLCPGVSAPLIAAQIESESSWNPNAVSPEVGAQGLSQFMPGTWKQFGRDADGDGLNSPFDPPDAIDAQARYDCYLLAEVKAYLKSGRLAGDPTDLMLAAYNWGIGNVLRTGGIPSQFPAETQLYIAKIRKLMAKYADVTPPATNVGTGGAAAVKVAAKQLGKPYVWGGGGLEKPSGIGRDGRGPGWDCSGLTRHAIWIASGRKLEIPRVSYMQALGGRAVLPTLNTMAPGDVIAFSLHGGRIDHVGLYAGNGTMIHAPRTGKNVEQVDLTDAYYSKLKWTVRRFL